jgi:hypothetical protein
MKTDMLTNYEKQCGEVWDSGPEEKHYEINLWPLLVPLALIIFWGFIYYVCFWGEK